MDPTKALFSTGTLVTPVSNNDELLLLNLIATALGDGNSTSIAFPPFNSCSYTTIRQSKQHHLRPNQNYMVLTCV